MDLLALADFTLVARYGGFGRAARAAGRPKATLSRRVAELEAALDLRLFERGARALKLTEEGRALFERAGRLLYELEETTAAIASGGEKPRGRLRISAPLLFSQTAMGKIAAGFALKYPEVRLEISTEDRAVDMIEEGFDLVIRVNPDPDDSLVGRAHDGRATIAIEPVLALSSLIMVRDAVRAGVGAGRLPVSLVSHDLADGSLVHWGDIEGGDIALWTLYPSRRLLSARVSAFLDYLKAAFPMGTPDELAAHIGK